MSEAVCFSYQVRIQTLSEREGMKKVVTVIGGRLGEMHLSISFGMRMRHTKMGPVQVGEYLVTSVFSSPGPEGASLWGRNGSTNGNNLEV